MKSGRYTSITYLMASTLFCLLASWSSADTSSGLIKGTVKDKKGAVVVGACVLVERYLAKSEGKDQSGSYSLWDQTTTTYQNEAAFEVKAPAGTYRVRVRAWGFRELLSESFRISSGASKTIDIALQESLTAQLDGLPEPPIEIPSITLRDEGVIRLKKFNTIWLSYYSGVRERENVIVTNVKDWEEFWDKVHSSRFPRPEIPPIDFEKSTIIASSYGEMNSGGYHIEILRLVERRESLDVWVQFSNSRGFNTAVTLAVTQPLHIIETDRVDKDIKFMNPRHESPCR